jgi:hypothetical protein
LLDKLVYFFRVNFDQIVAEVATYGTRSALRVRHRCCASLPGAGRLLVPKPIPADPLDDTREAAHAERRRLSPVHRGRSAPYVAQDFLPSKWGRPTIVGTPSTEEQILVGPDTWADKLIG